MQGELARFLLILMFALKIYWYSAVQCFRLAALLFQALSLDLCLAESLMVD